MSDEFDIVHLNQEQVQEIVDWAVATAAMTTLMNADAEGLEEENDEGKFETLEGYVQAITIIQDNMPTCLRGPAEIVAGEALEEAAADQEIVDEFLEELEGL
jgi:hypothetical protein